MKFWRDRDRCSKVEDGTIPYCNCSASVKDSWFVYVSTQIMLYKPLTHM